MLMMSCLFPLLAMVVLILQVGKMLVSKVLFSAIFFPAAG
jgi:hypothetical protein